MTYQALARKWRPQDFSHLIGQEPVVTALRNALTDGRIAQAYLFAGIRGVGKTTAARVLAKALNCERGPAGDPCNECRACREITSGADLDVLEVDAATYSKVEQVRELTESLRYGPAHNRYKVVVLDEVHRLSRQAFDALLKIVEEPPAHLVFIFATTEIEAVPATILSRCQEFHFRRVPSPVLAAHLETLAAAEGIDASAAALRIIARAGEGSVRDAVALLDQLATYGGGSIGDDDAARLLAGFDPALFHRILEATLRGDGKTVREAVQEIESEGRDPRQVMGGLLSYGRDALHLALGSPAESLDLPSDEAEQLASLVAATTYEELLRWNHHLLKSESLIRRSEAASIALEIALLRAAELPKLTRIEELFGREPSAPVTPTSGGGESPAPSDDPGLGSSSAAPTTEEASAETRPPTTDGTPSPPVVSAPAAVPPSRPAEPASDDPVDRLLQVVSRERQVLAAHLTQAQNLLFENGELVVFQDPDDPWLGQALQRDGNRTTLESALEEVFGADAGWSLRDGISSEPDPDSPPDPSPTDDPVQQDPTVQAVLQIFDGTIESSRDPS